MCKTINIKETKSYYFESVKFVRDLVHGYIYLTKFDLDIIDTLQFQRLKDIRQLTCQHIYPSARHTRFEHSLGVMELMRQAIRNINRNGFIENSSDNHECIINENIQFNAALAALLHDIGHCPFSHLGEAEFDADKVWRYLNKAAKECEELKDSSLLQEFKRYTKDKSLKKPGDKHEQLSCVIVLTKLKDLLSKVKHYNVKLDLKKNTILFVDYELIIRSILGMEYNTSTLDEFQKYKEKNIIVKLLNSSIFDMDKLDYIMRDSLLTGIGTPQIDTHRLFRNTFLNNVNEYKVVFTNRAVPTLQNMIESRDELYMYVYNHHTAVFSDFMSSYIFRRLAHNERDFLNLAKSFVDSENKKRRENNEASIISEKKLNTLLNSSAELVLNLGIVSKNYLFSPNALIDQNRSDSDLISLLNILHYNLSLIIEPNNEDDTDNIECYLLGEIENQLFPIKNKVKFDVIKKEALIKEDISKFINNIKRVYVLIDNYLKRQYLKPWWKTNSEFTNFINTNFKDDRVRETLCAWICESVHDLDSDEFRSQLAKNVIYITHKLWEEKQSLCKNVGLLEPLNDGDFFVIQRSARFFDPKTISELDIALKSSEIIGSPRDAKYNSRDFYIKALTKVIPQRNYYSMYAKNNFYIFSKPVKENKEGLISEKHNKHYHFIEQIFIFVATEIIKGGKSQFKNNYSNGIDEKKAHNKMYDKFINRYTNTIY